MLDFVIQWRVIFVSVPQTAPGWSGKTEGKRSNNTFKCNFVLNLKGLQLYWFNKSKLKWFLLKCRLVILKIFHQIIPPTCCPVSPRLLLWLGEGIDCSLGRPLASLTLLVPHPLFWHRPAALFHLYKSPAVYLCHTSHVTLCSDRS